MIQITSNRAKWSKGGNDTASVFRRNDVQASVKRDLAKAVRLMNKQQFAGQGIGKSGPWAPLAASTVKKKGHSRILFDTGRLFRQATRGGSVKAGYVPAFRVFQFAFTLKTKPAMLLTWLQKGTKKMPKRPVFDPTEKQIEEFSDVMWTAIKRAWTKIGWFDRISKGKYTGFDQVNVG